MRYKLIVLALVAASVCWGQPTTGNAGAIQGKAIKRPLTCSDTFVLTWVAANNRFECLAGGGGSGPALPFNSIQFNNAGAFGGSANFEYIPTAIGQAPDPTVTNVGTPGATSYSYACVPFTQANLFGLPSNTITTTTGNASLDNTNYNNVACPAITVPAGDPSTSGIVVTRVTGIYAVIGTLTATGGTIADKGQVATFAPISSNVDLSDGIWLGKPLAMPGFNYNPTERSLSIADPRLFPSASHFFPLVISNSDGDASLSVLTFGFVDNTTKAGNSAFTFGLANPAYANIQKGLWDTGVEGTLADNGTISGQDYYIFNDQTSAYDLKITMTTFEANTALAFSAGGGAANLGVCWKADGKTLGNGTIAEITAGTCH